MNGEVQDLPEEVGLAEERRPDLLLQADLLQGFLHGKVEQGIQCGEHAHEEQVLALIGGPRVLGHGLAEVGPYQGSHEKLGRLVIPEAGDGHEDDRLAPVAAAHGVDAQKAEDGAEGGEGVHAPGKDALQALRETIDQLPYLDHSHRPFLQIAAPTSCTAEYTSW